ncbi:hypothetical protein AMS68_002375 [Peltaster fructicola]|uniref:Uncharacterized protein n=1 Tax=Peltaster fructicola TaxID=286661 RepID=A0A6H0XQE2_9PEZI|nr:hypothetical protein AMS68_002375 [Peltaster fructicola]
MPRASDKQTLRPQLAMDSSSSSMHDLSAVDKELERINRYQDSSSSHPEMISWGVQCLRSPTLDQPDQYLGDRAIGLISNVSLPGTRSGSTWDIEIEGQQINDIAEHDASRVQPIMTNSINVASALLLPSLCHPHIHIDKAFLLAHPRYADLQIEKGTFEEAMELTNKAKANFTEEDLQERGQRVIDESVAAGVTHMRAFVEVDKLVDLKCLQAGIALKKQADEQRRCHVQICSYAQLPLFSTAQDDQDGQTIQKLMRHAAELKDVDAIGSTPYVEDDRKRMEQNIEWMIDLSIQHNKHLDFHLDYNLDSDQEPTIWHVLQQLKEKNWLERTKERTIILGHCTRLTLWDDTTWQRLRNEIGDLPVSFVGLPTSDIYMMSTKDKVRGTLDIPRMIKEHDLNACIGINNIGNAFTPQGSCDPLTLACNGVGIYQAGTEKDAALLYECISTRARQAIGVSGSKSEDATTHGFRSGDKASFLLLGADSKNPWRTRRKLSEAVYLYDHNNGRRVFYEGRPVE